ncbi:hypothetical protein ACFL41_00245 [Gemmatimonadota bacterium]
MNGELNYLVVESREKRILQVIDRPLSIRARDILLAQGILFAGILAPPINEQLPDLKGDFCS